MPAPIIPIPASLCAIAVVIAGRTPVPPTLRTSIPVAIPWNPDVAEAQRHAVDDRGAAVGAHHQQALVVRQPLEYHLVLDAEVVAEEHHVQVVLERLARLARGVGARDRDHRELGLRTRARRRSECAGRDR